MPSLYPDWCRTASGLRRAVLAAACFWSACAGAEITLNVQPNRTQIYLGESLLLNVTVNGTDDEQPLPDLSSLQADVQFIGSQRNSQQFISVVNGRITRSGTKARLFAFQLKPRAAGVFSTGPVKYKTDGPAITGRGPDVQVTGQEPQDRVVACVQASRASVLVDEPFTITLSVAIAALPKPNEAVEPVHPNLLPRLECGFLSLAEIPGLQIPNLQQTLQSLISNDQRKPAFQINDYVMRASAMFADPLGDFDPFQPRPIRFRLPPASVLRNGRAFHEYTLTLSYTPKQEGDYTFGPVTFKGDVITSANAQNQAVTRQISCVGPAVTVRVVPPPETNRPDWFIGSVGTNLSVQAELDATICKVGDPLTLTLDVTGALSLGNMRPPQLNLQPGLNTDFRIYDDNVEASAIPAGKRFRYRIRPIREGTLELPPIQVAWFDTASRAYRTALTQPIPVQARANTQIISEGTNASTHITRLAVERTTTTPSAITVVRDGSRGQPLLPSGLVMLTLLGSAPLCLMLSWCGLLLYQHRDSLSAAHRRNRALPQALAALHAASLAPSPDAAAVGHLIRGFLAARLGVAGSALTAGDVVPLLQHNRVPDATATACGDLLARLDQALYRPDTAGTGLAEIIQESLTLLPEIAAALDRPPVQKEDAP
ncbi:MAG: BatD family protein [Kiritimatiellia bacterium]